MGQLRQRNVLSYLHLKQLLNLSSANVRVVNVPVVAIVSQRNDYPGTPFCKCSDCGNTTDYNLTTQEEDCDCD